MVSISVQIIFLNIQKKLSIEPIQFNRILIFYIFKQHISFETYYRKQHGIGIPNYAKIDIIFNHQTRYY